MTDLVTAAKQALSAMDYMLQHGEWYQAQERADALRDALRDTIRLEQQRNELVVSNEEKEALSNWGELE